MVLNPTAGHGRASRERDDIEASARALGLELDTHITRRRGHATEIVENARLEDYDGIVAGGGDGTVFETVSGLFRNPAGATLPFGVLPVGTGNSFSRDIGLNGDRPRRALEIIAAGRTRTVDVGRCRFGDHEVHFLNILGVGFVTDVTGTAARLKVLGNGAYHVGVIYRTVFLDTFPLRIELDGRFIERDATFLEISNSRYTADFLMAPSARIDDGLLDITLLGKISRRRLLRLFPTVFSGDHIHHSEVETFTATHVAVATEVPKTLSPDGELKGATPAEITCLHRALQVFQ